MPEDSPVSLKTLAVAALVIIGLAIAAVQWHGKPAPEEPPPPPGVAADPATVEYFQRRVQPILRANCYRCHAGFLPKGGLRVDTPANILRGGKHGSILTPGHPGQSKLVIAIRHEGSTDATKPMPPKSKLTDADIATVTAWIAAGAILPEGSKQ